MGQHRDRPLVGEPVAMDLLNTRWVGGGVEHDLLDSMEGLRQWLAETGLDARFEAGPAALDRLLRVRGTLGSLIADPGEAVARAELNDVLVRGCVRRRLLEGAEGGPGTAGFDVEFDDPAWGPAWTAADGYLDLLRAPERIRRCANPACVLVFFDTSKNGTRRWCSMAGCGNRAKAARHQARGRAGRTA
ncbi:putative RNA-binding Zn ribbon-like protein [Nocardiopsis sp. Huas11]|uniref:CGNR zinc finger domain-containing protein n=1 Tax=Nocardiopsis sp. Huas11 TaxID=2183912 RepID=UPI000F2B7D92|nr:CGNR zinc finger domain-containing protein [Nocardiopsis sp. Huas11]RKS09676.1 putative RNA-binding Zn ribbon-like protein [Nocardiopsis sp. Huas11]